MNLVLYYLQLNAAVGVTSKIILFWGKDKRVLSIFVPTWQVWGQYCSVSGRPDSILIPTSRRYLKKDHILSSTKVLTSSWPISGETKAHELNWKKTSALEPFLSGLLFRVKTLWSKSVSKFCPLLGRAKSDFQFCSKLRSFAF